MRISVAVVAGALLGLPAAAAAQDLVQQPSECLCVLQAQAGPQIAAVEDVRGQVFLSGALGYTPIQSNAGLSAGDRVVLLNDGQAVLTGAACRIALAPDSMVSLIPTDDGVCVARALAPQAVDAQLVYDPVPALVGAALTAGGMATIILLAKEDAPPRPVSP